ncbi:MAG TPA: hypothetical protein VHG91_03915 [Longimicrobium sp.]|nr:hypothetical protein [Longimicrobium sp.]
MTTPPHSALIGRRARFRIRDVHIPEPAEVLEALHGGDLLQGEILDLSDSGVDPAVYAVVKVDALERPLVVAVERLLPVD